MPFENARAVDPSRGAVRHVYMSSLPQRRTTRQLIRRILPEMTTAYYDVDNECRGTGIVVKLSVALFHGNFIHP